MARMSRQHSGGRRAAPRRNRSWATVQAFTSLLAPGGIANVDMLSAFTGVPTIGCTIQATHLTITPNAAPTLLDRVVYGLIVGRVSDVADPTTAGLISPSQNELDWMWWDEKLANPVFGDEGTNRIVVHSKSRRKLGERDLRYILSIQNNQAAATQYRIVARTLVLLP